MVWYGIVSYGIVSMTSDPSFNFPYRWHTTDWTDCSKSCGKGQQTRKLVCRMKITANKYGLSNSCSNNTKPVVKETIRSCNSFACKADWDTEEGLPVSGLQGSYTRGGRGGSSVFCFPVNRSIPSTPGLGCSKAG